MRQRAMAEGPVRKADARLVRRDGRGGEGLHDLFAAAIRRGHADRPVIGRGAAAFGIAEAVAPAAAGAARFDVAGGEGVRAIVVIMAKCLRF